MYSCFDCDVTLSFLSLTRSSVTVISADGIADHVSLILEGFYADIAFQFMNVMCSCALLR